MAAVGRLLGVWLMRIASFNVESLYERPVAMAPETKASGSASGPLAEWQSGAAVLAAFAQLNTLLAQTSYSAADKTTIVALLKQLGLGIQQYAQDYDGHYPRNASRFNGWTRAADVASVTTRTAELIGHLGGAVGYFAYVGRLPRQKVTLASAMNSSADPSPLLIPVFRALAKP